MKTAQWHTQCKQRLLQSSIALPRNVCNLPHQLVRKILRYSVHKHHYHELRTGLLDTTDV